MLASAAAGVVGGAICALYGPWQVAVLSGWDVAALLFLLRIWLSVWRLDATQTASVARREDSSVALADLVIVSAAMACIAGAGLTLIEAAHSNGDTKAGLVTLAVLSVVLSWAAVHTVFTLRYARLFYAGEHEGIEFSDNPDGPPNYLDFAYVAFTVGMTFQVSDTDITSSAIRRTILRHALISYVFGAVIIGLTINIVASLLH